MKIVQLTAENIKRLHAVNITPDGHLVQITGKNGHGKTSVLDAITFALAGKSVQPPKPIRDGEDHAEVVVDLGDKIITRRWTKTNSYLSIESKDGAKYPSPQKLLDELAGELTFDPLAFARMNQADQVATLKKIIGIDFEALDCKRTGLYEKRTAAGRHCKALESQISAIPQVKCPDEEVSIHELLKEQSEINSTIQANAAKRAQLKTLSARTEEIEKEIVALRNTVKTNKKMLKELEDECASLVDPAVDEIKDKIINAQSVNEQISAKKKREELCGEHRSQAAIKDGLTKKIKKIDSDKASAISNAKLPIDGLGFDEDGVTLNGLPIVQASSAEALRASVAIGIALNPKLRIMLIKDGSLLDDDGLAMLADIAEKNDTQIWLERVSDGENVGIVIADGTNLKKE